MGYKKRLISVVTVAIFLIVMGIAATGFPAQQTPATQQQPAVQQQTPVKAVAAPIHVTATLGVRPASYTGNCPALISFRGHITVNQPTTARYKFIRSDNAEAPVQTLNFPKAGTQEVTTTWQLGGPGLPTYSGWEAIEVISPVSVQSNKANFSIRCAGQGQQGGPGQQPGQQGQQGIPIDVKARLSAKPASYTGNCPALITFGGYIAVNQPMTVQYKFIRSDNAEAPVQTLYFSSKSSQEVTTTWQLGGPGLPTYSGWEAIQVTSPVSVQSNRANFSIRCAGQGQGQPGQQGGPGEQGQLPDLAIEDITLNEQCFVVVTAKNNGPGAVPDKVWTDRAPDSSAIYLHINGKKWGGQTIAGFDPAKNLQNPGGMATMTSKLKVTGTATIEAYIDHTHKVKETDEKNNVMKKGVTCKTIGAVQTGTTTLSAPRQLSPQSGSTFNFFPRKTTLKWSAVLGATAYGVEIDCFSCCVNNRWCTDVGKEWNVVPNVKATEYTFDFVGAQPGRWRVWAVGPRGETSPKTGWWEFKYTK
jgi:hypothetical protein